jgi:hypothetical protein
VLVVQALPVPTEQMAVLPLLLALLLLAEAEEERNLLALMVVQAEEAEWQYLTLSTLVVREQQVKEITAVQVGVLELTQTCRPEAEAAARMP